MQFYKLALLATAPSKAYVGDWCYDFHALESGTIAPGDVARVRTGIGVMLPHDVGLQLCTRSGHAYKVDSLGNIIRSGVIVIGGVIDPGYTGEIIVILANIGKRLYCYNSGDAICQGKLEYIVPSTLRELTTSEWEEGIMGSKRGSAGFGSSDSGLL